MKNMISGILGAFLGSFITGYFISTTVWPDPGVFENIYFIFEGAMLLVNTLNAIMTQNFFLEILTVWLFIGIISSFFASSKWNQFRTLAYTGCSLALLSMIGILIQNPNWWNLADRNFQILMIFLGGITSSLIALVSSIPLIVLLSHVRRADEKVAPEKIETTCICGAVYRSRPMICANCGAVLDDSLPLSTDSSTE